MLIMMRMLSNICRCGKRGSTGRNHAYKSQIDCRRDSDDAALDASAVPGLHVSLPIVTRIRSSPPSRLPVPATNATKSRLTQNAPISP